MLFVAIGRGGEGGGGRGGDGKAVLFRSLRSFAEIWHASLHERHVSRFNSFLTVMFNPLVAVVFSIGAEGRGWVLICRYGNQSAYPRRISSCLLAKSWLNVSRLLFEIFLAEFWAIFSPFFRGSEGETGQYGCWTTERVWRWRLYIILWPHTLTVRMHIFFVKFISVVCVL